MSTGNNGNSLTARRMTHSNVPCSANEILSISKMKGGNQ